MTEKGLYIIGAGPAGICESGCPESVGAASPLWEESITGFGPWEPVMLTGSGETPGLDAWRSKGYPGPETVFICAGCASTMDLSRGLISLGVLKAWDSVIAVCQTAGRGQHGRSWESLSGNLFASWIWPQFDGAVDPSGRWPNMASLLAGGALADFFTAIGLGVEVKWPNDLLYQDKKFCGILVEDCSGLLVTGIGINIKSAPGTSRLWADGSIPATSLLSAGKKFRPLELWLDILASGKLFYTRMTRYAGPDFFIQWLDAKLAWKGRDVVISEFPGREISARISGLAPDGGLEILSGRGTEVIYNGRILPAG